MHCSFGGASALEDDRAARGLEVDEHGIARRLSNDVWSESNATSRCSTCSCMLRAMHHVSMSPRIKCSR